MTHPRKTPICIEDTPYPRNNEPVFYLARKSIQLADYNNLTEQAWLYF